MRRNPLLTDIRISLSGICSICGDYLLATPKNLIEKNALESAMNGLQNLFRSHLGSKHEIASSRKTAR